jgi:hypothetical protein
MDYLAKESYNPATWKREVKKKIEEEIELVTVNK